MFSCCDPRLPEEAQVALVLHILCGFSVSEVASAFVSTHGAMEKRITRAKKTLATSKKLFDVAISSEVSTRLPSVLRALYLLFNEGYHGASAETSVRDELCREAMRLTFMLLEHPTGATPMTYALAAMMALHAARLPARIDSSGNLISLMHQDRTQWDRKMAGEGLKLLERASSGPTLTEYHVEAAIASVHMQALRMEDTNWGAIVSLYDTLMSLHPSPIIALNRAIAVAQHEGPERGLAEIRSIKNSDRLAAYPFYPAALGELELHRGAREIARGHFQAALALARNPMESQFFERRISVCEIAGESAQ